MITFEEMKKKVYPKIATENLTESQKKEIENRMARRNAMEKINPKNDALLPVKCAICGKIYPFKQLDYDSNFGWICKKCDEDVAC